MNIMRERSVIAGVDVLHIFQDGIHVSADYARIERCQFIDKPEGDAHLLAHRDAIQLIPRSSALHNIQYAAGSLSGVEILFNRFDCRSQMQPIFSSDGLLRGAKVMGNQIQTESQHKITLNGLVSGVFYNNKDYQGNPVPVVLNPLRIGGGVDGHNVWVVGFKYEKDEYRAIQAENLTDNRQLPNRKGDTYLTNFDIDAFRLEATQLLEAQNGVDQLCRDLRWLAKKHGDLC